MRLGNGDYVYAELADWARPPTGWSFQDVPDVAADAQDRVYVFSRADHRMIVFEPDGTFVTSWGEGPFVPPHGVTLGPDGALYCVDDGAHCVYKRSLDGQVLAIIGTSGQPAPRLNCSPT